MSAADDELHTISHGDGRKSAAVASAFSREEDRWLLYTVEQFRCTGATLDEAFWVKVHTYLLTNKLIADKPAQACEQRYAVLAAAAAGATLGGVHRRRIVEENESALLIDSATGKRIFVANVSIIYDAEFRRDEHIKDCPDAEDPCDETCAHRCICPCHFHVVDVARRPLAYATGPGAGLKPVHGVIWKDEMATVGRDLNKQARKPFSSFFFVAIAGMTE